MNIISNSISTNNTGRVKLPLTKVCSKIFHRYILVNDKLLSTQLGDITSIHDRKTLKKIGEIDIIPGNSALLNLGENKVWVTDYEEEKSYIYNYIAEVKEKEINAELLASGAVLINGKIVTNTLDWETPTVRAYDSATGNVIWQFSGSASKGFVAVSGFIVFCDGVFLYCVDEFSGSPIWKKNMEDLGIIVPAKIAYSSQAKIIGPYVTLHNGNIVVATGVATLSKIDIRTGCVIWSCACYEGVWCPVPCNFTIYEDKIHTFMHDDYYEIDANSGELLRYQNMSNSKINKLFLPREESPTWGTGGCAVTKSHIFFATVYGLVFAFNKEDLSLVWHDFVDDTLGVLNFPKIEDGRLVILGSPLYKYLHIWEGADGFLADE